MKSKPNLNPARPNVTTRLRPDNLEKRGKQHTTSTLPAQNSLRPGHSLAMVVTHWVQFSGTASVSMLLLSSPMCVVHILAVICKAVKSTATTPATPARKDLAGGGARGHELLPTSQGVW